MTNIPIINNINSMFKGHTDYLKLWDRNSNHELQQAVIYLIELGEDFPNFVEYSARICDIATRLKFFIKRTYNAALHQTQFANNLLVEFCQCMNSTGTYWSQQHDALISNFIDASLASHESRYSQCARIQELHRQLYGKSVPHILGFKSFPSTLESASPTQHEYDNLTAWIALLKSEPILLEYPQVQEELLICIDLQNSFNRDNLEPGIVIRTAKEVWTGTPDIGNHFKVHHLKVSEHSIWSSEPTY